MAVQNPLLPLHVQLTLSQVAVANQAGGDPAELVGIGSPAGTPPLAAKL